MYSLTIFKNRFDNKTNKRMDFSDWEKFVELLRQLSRQRLDGKDAAQLISPAVFADGTTRANKNVEHWGKWAAVDVDEWTAIESDPLLIGLDLRIELESRFPNWEFICYSTASSTISNPKFRIVFRLDRKVEKEEIKHFWFALNSYLGSIGDSQTKDMSRMYYIPGDYEGAFNFIFRVKGDAVSVDDLLNKYEFKEKSSNSFLDKLPPELQKEVLEHRKSQLKNKNIHWTNYKDCPFFPKQLANEYRSITKTGWYHTMFRIMVAIACNAIKMGYPITADEIAELCKQLDLETGRWYEKRPLKVEANSALEYAYRNVDYS